MADALTNKKLKIWSAATSQVVVCQDGSAADGDATIKIDDGFQDGYSPSAQFVGDPRRIVFNLIELSNGPNGSRLVFEVADWIAWNTLNLGPNDRVELELEVANTYYSSGFPSWHLATAAGSGGGQTRVFYGFIEAVRREQDTSGREVMVCECVDAATWADRVKVMQSKGSSRDVDIPHVYFNVEETTDPDFWYSIKVFDRSDGTVINRYGTGTPLDPADYMMSLTDILTYLDEAYQGDLSARNIISTTCFDSTEIAQFSGVTPPKTVFENVGFDTAVRQLVKNNLVDWDVFFDPRAQQWRFRPVHRDLAVGVSTTISSIDGTRLIITVGAGQATQFDDADIGAIRIQDASNVNNSIVREIASVNAGANTITLTQTIPATYGASDVIYGMWAATDRVPFVGIDIDDVAENTLTEDLQGVYTAVNIVGRKQKTEDVLIKDSILTDGPSAIIEGTWDSDFEASYNVWRHRNRSSDDGADGLGIYIDELTTVGGKTWVYFSEEHSEHGADHAESIGASNISEWDGTVFRLLTTGGEADDLSAAKRTAYVESFAASGWMDSPTNSIRRFVVKLDRDITSDTPTVQDEVNDAAPDRFQLTSSELYAPQKPNARFAIGRHFRISATDSSRPVRDFNPAACAGAIVTGREAAALTQWGAGPRPLPALFGPSSVDGAPRTYEEQQAYFGFGTNNPFAQVTNWIISQPQPQVPVSQPAFACNPVGSWLPPITPPFQTRKVTSEAFSVRVPGTGYEGLANIWRGHAEDLYIIADSFEDESQESQFEAIALAIWRRVSEPHYTGSVRLYGVETWLGLLDLGFRCQFAPGLGGYASGAVAELSRFYGLCQSITFDFQELETRVSFERAGLESLNQDLLDRLYVSETAAMAEIRRRLDEIEERERCQQSRTPQPSPLPRDSCSVGYQGQSITKRVTVINPKQDPFGWGETSLGVTPSTTSNAGNNSGTTAWNPEWIVERDANGVAFGIQNSTGAIWGGTEAGTKFTPTGSHVPASVPQQAADAVQEVSEATMGLDLQTPLPPLSAATGSGSTTTVIELANPIPNDGRFNGGFIEFAIFGGATVRPTYEIDSHDASSVTLSSAMSEAAPAEGLSCKLWPSRLPTLNATDFPNGGRPAKDAKGEWVVIVGGDILPAQLSGSELITDTHTPLLEVGNAGADVNAKGDWSFTGAASVAHRISTTPYRALEDLSDGLQIKVDESSGIYLSSNGLALKRATKTGTVATVEINGSSEAYVAAATGSNAGAMTAAQFTDVEALRSDGLQAAFDLGNAIVQPTTTTDYPRFRHEDAGQKVIGGGRVGFSDVWSVDSDGDAIFNDVTVQGSLSLAGVGDIETGDIADDAVTVPKIAAEARSYRGFMFEVRFGSAINAGTISRGLIDAGEPVGFVVPNGKTLKVMGIAGLVKTGASAGTYDIRVGIRANSFDDASKTAHECAAATSSSTDTWIEVSDWTDDESSPLASVTGDGATKVHLYMENKGTSPAATAATTATLTAWAFIE